MKPEIKAFMDYLDWFAEHNRTSGCVPLTEAEYLAAMEKPYEQQV